MASPTVAGFIFCQGFGSGLAIAARLFWSFFEVWRVGLIVDVVDFFLALSGSVDRNSRTTTTCEMKVGSDAAADTERVRDELTFMLFFFAVFEEY